MYYGVLKSAGEQAVRCSNTSWMIIRPILMYGWPNEGRRKNWATTWLNKLKNKEECLVVNDTITQPLYNADCAKAIWTAINRNMYKECFNLAGPEKMTLYDFANIIADVIKADKNLIINFRIKIHAFDERSAITLYYNSKKAGIK